MEIVPVPVNDGSVRPDGDRIEELAEQHVSRLKLLTEWRKGLGAERRAFIIEFAGMPKAGKSTIIKTIRHYFLHGSKSFMLKGFRIHTPAEGVSLRTPNDLKGNLADYNTWAGAYAIQELLQAQHDSKNHLAILDRGPWDAGCWLYYVLKHHAESFGRLEDDDSSAQQVVDFFQSTRWMVQSDLHVVLVVDPAEAARRETAERLIRHKGPAQDLGWMREMREIYENRFPELHRQKAEQCPQVGQLSAMLIDTTARTAKSVAWSIIERALEILEIKARSKSEIALIREPDVWRHLQPYVEGFIRKDEIPALKEYIPDFLKLANSSPVLQARVRKGLMDMAFALPLDETLVANRGEAAKIIDNLKSLLAEPPDEL